jgi:hypothetical protein
VRQLIPAWLPVALLASTAVAQGCPVNLTPVGANYGYQHRTNPDRCEGMYASPVAGEELEMLSFTAGRADNTVAQGGRLRITTPTCNACPFRGHARFQSSVGLCRCASIIG